MDTPRRLTLAATQAKIAEFFTSRCCLTGPAELVCASCGGEIRRTRAFMSLHDERFGDACVGPTCAWRMDIPYCTNCEEPPGRYGCIHMSEAELNLPSVIEASRPFPAKPARLLKLPSLKD